MLNYSQSQNKVPVIIKRFIIKFLWVDIKVWGSLIPIQNTPQLQGICMWNRTAKCEHVNVNRMHSMRIQFEWNRAGECNLRWRWRRKSKAGGGKRSWWLRQAAGVPNWRALANSRVQQFWHVTSPATPPASASPACRVKRETRNSSETKSISTRRILNQDITLALIAPIARDPQLISKLTGNQDKPLTQSQSPWRNYHN